MDVAGGVELGWSFGDFVGFKRAEGSGWVTAVCVWVERGEMMMFGWVKDWGTVSRNGKRCRSQKHGFVTVMSCVVSLIAFILLISR